MEITYSKYPLEMNRTDYLSGRMISLISVLYTWDISILCLNYAEKYIYD